MKSIAPLSALLPIAVIASCHRADPATVHAAAPLPPTQAHVVTVRSENIPVLTEITGTIRPLQRAQIAAKVMGSIEAMPITLGQPVARGDLLVKISAGEINARVTQAQSQLNAARRDLDRERELLRKSASTADMVRGLEDRFTAAQAMVREAEVMLGYATIRAPFDGVVARKLANVGDLASPGFPLIELDGRDGFEVEAAVPDSLAAGLAAGAALSVEVPAASVTVSGRLAELSSAADSAARSVTAKIALPAHAGLRAGQFARIQIPGTPRAGLWAPRAAISPFGQMERVFVAATDNRTRLRLVKTGAIREERVEILAGLDDGERVVVDPPAGLREGQPLVFKP